GDHRDRTRPLGDADEGGDEERHKEGWQADRGDRLGESVTDAGLTQYESEASAGTGDEQDESGRGRPVGEPSLHRVAGGHAWKQSIDGEDEADDQSDNGVAEEGQRSDPGRRFVRIAGELPLGVLVDRGADGIGDDEQQRHDEREEAEEGAGAL